MSSISILQPTSVKYLGQIQEFIKSIYRDDIALLAPDIFMWQFGKDCEEGFLNIITAMDGDNVVGIYGYVPVDFFIGSDSRRRKFYYGMNWYASEEYRYGVGWGMLEQLKRAGEGILSVGFTEITRQLTELDGWRSFFNMPRVVLPIDLTVLGHSEIRYNSKPENCGAVIREFDYGAFEPDWQHYSYNHYGVVKDKDYIAWRYLRHPAFDYKCFVSGEPGKEALCIYRIERAFGKWEGKVARIVDFIMPAADQGRRNAESLLNSVVNNIIDAGCAYADFACSRKEYTDLFKKNGFVPDSEAPVFLPSRLTPVQDIESANDLLVYSADDIYPEFSGIYATSGDGDADRLRSRDFLDDREFHLLKP